MSKIAFDVSEAIRKKLDRKKLAVLQRDAIGDSHALSRDLSFSRGSKRLSQCNQYVRRSNSCS